MHELSYILDIIETTNEAKLENGLKTIKKIKVDVGKMSGVLPYYLNKYFDEVKHDYDLQDSSLEINEIEVVIECSNCKSKYVPGKEYNYKCPKCGERSGKLIQGKGVTVREIIGDD